jgi:hypothetical protein
MDTPLGEFSLARMESAVRKVQERLSRAIKALQAAHIPYAVTDEHAVAYWVSRVDPSAVRNARGVEVLLRREDWDRALQAMENAGFTYCHAAGPMFFSMARPGNRAMPFTSSSPTRKSGHTRPVPTPMYRSLRMRTGSEYCLLTRWFASSWRRSATRTAYIFGT